MTFLWTWLVLLALVVAGCLLPELAQRACGGPMACRLMSDGHLARGHRWCKCVSAGQCVNCPAEDRP